RDRNSSSSLARSNMWVMARFFRLRQFFDCNVFVRCFGFSAAMDLKADEATKRNLFVILGVIHSENAIKPQPNVVVLTPDDIIIPIVWFHNALEDYGVSMGEHAIPT